MEMVIRFFLYIFGIAIIIFCDSLTSDFFTGGVFGTFFTIFAFDLYHLFGGGR